MPNEKLFECLTNEIDPAKLLLGIGGLPLKTVMKNGYEVAEQYYLIVTNSLKYLEEGKKILLESTKDEETSTYWIKKKSSNLFSFKTPQEEFEVDMLTVLNFLFKHAPYIPVVAYSS